MKTLGIDFGERRIGLALSDPEGRLALPLRTLERTDDRRVIELIEAVVREEEVALLVVGEPRRPSDGGQTAASRRVRSFGEKLARATGLPVEWIDESHTSQEAESRLREAGVSAAQRARRIDAVAAQIVLQEALDRRLRRGEP
jgi:putative Holliday junction resolvase